MTPETVRYYSTNRSVRGATLGEALLLGQAADRGLFLPDSYPAMLPRQIAALADRSYPEVARFVLERFTRGSIGESRLLELCEDAYDFEVPIERVSGRAHILRLDRGPTASFKDFAARMMARWMGIFLEGDPSELVILTATSGDTGSAVAHAYHGVERVSVVVLFPEDEVSDRQRRQMTTLGGNVTTIAVRGKFDDCQAMVKRAFADPGLAEIRLSSANSINIGRLLPQAVYYVYAYARLARVAEMEPIVFAVPSGNFGDMMGAVIAGRLGVPIERLVVATNANDEFPRFLATGVYEKIVPSRVSISNAMNVGHPSNLARLVDAYGGFMDETGAILEMPDLPRLRRDLFAVSVSDDETRETIRAAWKAHRVLLEPHGAVGWAGLRRFLHECAPGSEPLSVCIETAHPAKFPEEIRALVGVDPEPPPSLRGLDERPERFDRMAADYERFRERLRDTFLRP